MKKILILISLLALSGFLLLKPTYAFGNDVNHGPVYQYVYEDINTNFHVAYDVLPGATSYTFELVDTVFGAVTYRDFNNPTTEIDIYNWLYQTATNIGQFPQFEDTYSTVIYGSLRISGLYDNGSSLEPWSYITSEGFQFVYEGWQDIGPTFNEPVLDPTIRIYDFNDNLLHIIDLESVIYDVTTFVLEPIDLTNPTFSWEVGNSTLTEITSNYFGLEMGLINSSTPATTISGLASLLYADFDTNYGPNSNHTYIFDVYNASLLRTNPSIPNIYLPSIALLIWEYEKDYDGVIVKENLYMYSREGHLNWQVDYINNPEDFNITVPNDQYTLGYNEGRASVEIINERLREREYQRGYVEARNYFGKYIDVNDIWVTATLWGTTEYQRGLNASQQESYDEGYRVGAKESFLGSLDTWIVPAIFIVIVVGGFFALRGRREN